MFDALLQGIFLGLVLSVFVGPGFFMLVKTSVSQGIKAALILDAGIVFSDLFCIVLSYLGLAQLMQRPTFSLVFTVGGGVLLIAYGIYTALKKEKQQETIIPVDITKAHGVKLFVKGFIFNTSVPSVIFFWIATVSLAIAQFQNNRTQTLIYLSSVLLTYFVIDILKIYLASKAKRLFSGHKQHIVKKLAGIALVVFGAVIIFKVIMARY
jgi:threonine/homoserine/homoserine lactone efflux protein